ncbi:uncharacterized protein B0P05DRAFT_548293 [Gilbertella persicaria]|uniref:uncharacterized protein n=1 Tax=Gilbertella persicaria TaxID=101096 RepID=UPI00222029C7|nr:uncharacterized protein B0P05DRAFT_548293 [Gilbertella persicaria]KAI8073392.1 hypothetical protein B0P05DRAFT_548293 [Gilbertella persicaria]
MPKTDTSFSTYTSMMRVTSKGRPYTKDLYDMFAAVLLQIELTDHRIMFRTYPYTFTTAEAAQVMSSLTFIHVHRKPDPADPSRQIATRTTTTFSMDYGTAKHLLQQFLAARLIMSATDPTNWSIKDKGLWSPTLKGKYVLEEFTDSTQVEMPNTLIAALNAPYMSPGSTGRLITLERLSDNDDQITFARPNMTIAFKAMMSSLPRDALFMEEIVGVEKRSFTGQYEHTIVGTHCVEWLCDRLTVNSREEAEMVAAQFVLFGWIALVLDRSDRVLNSKDDAMAFKTARNAIYYITERGCLILGAKAFTGEEQTSSISADSVTTNDSHVIMKQAPRRRNPSANSNVSYESTEAKPAEMIRHDSATAGITPPERPPSMIETSPIKDNSQWTRLMQILETPLMRMYFRDFLRSNYCVENINFWVDHNKLIASSNKNVIDQLSDAYAIYENYLGPQATADLNIDHTLNQDIIRYCSTYFYTVNQTPPSHVPHFTMSFPTPNHTTVAPSAKSSKASTRLLLLPPQVVSGTSKKRIVVIRGMVPEKCLSKLLFIFSKVNDHVCRMMAEDSVPKFIKTKKYKDLILQQEKKKQEQHEEESDEESIDIYFEDSDEENQVISLTTALSAQRSSMDHQRHRNDAISIM